MQKTLGQRITTGDKIIANQYKLVRKLKTGGFAEVYIGRSINEDATKYAIKLMSGKNLRYATNEYEIYQLIKTKKFTLGFIKLFEYGIAQDQIFLAMELIGYDLEEIMTRLKAKKFSLKTVLMIGLQVIDRIEALHGIGYAHRDIKPDNLAIGSKQKNNVIYLFDFGLAIKAGDPLPAEEKGKMIGTLGFMSLRCHDGKKANYYDDLESFVYTLVYLAIGILPWMNINVKTNADYHRIKIMKQKLNKDWFKRNDLPNQIYEILQIARTGNEKTPIDYLNIKYKLLTALNNIKQENDFNFDWCGVLKVTHDKEDSPPKRVEERKKINQMNKSNQKIVQNEIFQVYKFMDHEKKQEDKSIQKKPAKKSPERKIKRQGQKQKEGRNLQTNKRNQRTKQKRPMSHQNPRQEKVQKTKWMNEIEKKLKEVGPMNYQGPRIVINRTAQHKI